MNSFHSSALKATLLATLFVAGCGPKDGIKDYEAGKAAFKLRDFARAEKAFLKSAAQAPERVDTLVYLTRLNLEVGEIAKAAEWLAKAEALAAEDADVRLLRGHIAWHQQDFATAAKVFTAVARDAQLPATIRAEGYSGLGLVEMAQGHQHLARVAFLRAIQQDRRLPVAWYHLGLLYRDGFGYYEAALEQFEIFIHLEVMADMRVQKVQRNVIPALKEIIQQATVSRPGVSKRNSTAASAALLKAEAAEKKGTFKTARAAYQEALSADPLSAPAAQGLAKMYLKTDATKEGLRKALEYYKIACELRPSAVSNFLSAGNLANRLGYNGMAVEIYSRAVAASPTSLEALDGLVNALRKSGGHATAAQAYQDYRNALPKAQKKGNKR